MARQREIGGYFGLEVGQPGRNPHAGARALNSARNCLLYVLLARRPARLYLPAYLCDSLLEPLHQAAVEPVFYNIDGALEIAQPPALRDGECLLYVDYFGVKNAYCRRLAAHYGTALILDRSQALFAPPPGCGATLYSPRKFFGVADGGYLYCDVVLDGELEQDVSYDSVRHLVGRLDVDAASFYDEFCRSERRLSGRPLRRMSALTAAILDGVDFDAARAARQRNFLHLHAALAARNRLPLDPAAVDGPLVYPLWTDDPTLRGRLLARRIYVATYWNEVTQREQASAVEKALVAQLIPLPLDQRYGAAEMQAILDVVDGRAVPAA